MSEFSFVPVPIGTYHQQTFPALDADDQAARVAELVEELGGREEHWESGPRDYSSVGSRLRRWALPPSPRSSMLYWAGHGQALGPKAWLAVEDSPDPMTVNSLNPGSFAEYVIEEWRHRSLDEDAWALVVIEACGAKRFVEILLSRLYDEGGMDRLAVIGVGGYGSGYLGKFQQVLSDALAGYSDNDEAIHLRDLVGRVQDRLGDHGMVADLGLYQAPPLPRRRLTGPVTAPLDVYAELRDFVATLTPDERGHFLPKAQSAEQGELAWYFMGRREEGARIADWLHSADQGMLVVTGEAGSGKSALLGNVVVQANPELGALLARAGMTDGADAGRLPPPHVFDAVLHLTGATTAEVVRQLAAPIAPEEPVEDADQLVALLEERDDPFTVLVDALDEAQDPMVVARGILARIAEVDVVRVLVGTRSSTKEGPDSPAGEDTDILDALGDTQKRIIVGRDSAAADEYVRRRLLAAFPAIDTAELDAVRQEIAARERHFLYARLAVHELIARPELFDAAHRERRAELLAHDYRALFAAAVSRLGERDAAFAPLLEALALGQGRGLPRTDGVWQIAARTLDGVAIDEGAVDALLADAAPYIMLDAEHGQSVYRLAHRTFQEHYFAARAGELDGQQRLVAGGLADAAEAVLPSPPNPYLVHHLAGHVAAAEDWQLLMSRPSLLDQLAPGAIAAQAARAGRLPGAISAIRAAHHRLAAAEPSERGSLRAVAEAQFTGRLPDAEGWWSPEAAWAPVWADFRRLRSSTTSVFTLDCEKLTALTALRWGDGRTVVALAEESHPCRIHFWDPVTLATVGEPLAVPGKSRVVLAAVPASSERDHLAVAGGGEVDIWDPRERKRIHSFNRGGGSSWGPLAAVRTRGGSVLLAYTDGLESVIHIRDLSSDHEVEVDAHNTIGAMIGLQRNDGSPRLVIAGRYDSSPIPRDLIVPEAPVEILVAKGSAEMMAEVPGEQGRLVMSPMSVGRRALTLWDTETGSVTELPIMVDLSYRGEFTLVRSSSGEPLLVSITGADQKITVFASPKPVEASTRFQSVVSVRTVRMDRHRDVFAVCPADGEFGFRDPSTGDPIDQPQPMTTRVTGPTDGPLLISSLRQEIWTRGRGRRPFPETPFVIEHTPFLSSKGRLLVAHFELSPEEREIVCSEERRHRGDWKVDRRIPCAGLGFPTSIRALTRPGSGPLLLAHFSEHPVVFDYDHPKRTWVLSDMKTPHYRGAALLSLPGPVLAVCDHRTVVLWDFTSRTKIAVLGGNNDIIKDMTEVRATPAGPVLLAVAHTDGVLRLWDPTQPDEPLAVIELDMAAESIAAAGTKLCLVNEEGALCIDIAGIVGSEVTRPPTPRPAVRKWTARGLWNRIRTRRGRPV